MKRILSLTLALVMVLGTVTTVFAADVPTVEQDAGKFLDEKGILLGDDEGDLMLEDNLERRDAVVLLSRLLAKEGVAKAFPTSEESPSWTDVRTDAYYVPYFAWAETETYFEGNDDGTFAPRADIKAPEYALVLLRALGHDAKGYDSWKAALDTAKNNGLLKDVDVKFEDELTRGEMAVMTFNALGTKMKDSDKTLAEFLEIEMPAAKELKVEKVYTENLAEVVVELSNADLVKNREALTNPNNYRLDDSAIKVYNVDVDGNDLILTLVPYGRVDEQEDFKTLVKGKEYKLTIRNVEKISETIKFEAKDMAVPAVEKVEVLGTHGIKVTTTEPVNNPQERNFKVGDRRTSMIIEQYGRELILTPYHKSAFDKDADKLVVDELNDFANYRSATTFEDLKDVASDATPEVVKAYRNGSKLRLVFDRDVYRKSVSAYENRRNEGNVSFVERRVTFFAEEAKKVDTNVVEYEFEREIPRDAVVTVEGVENHNEKAMEKQEVETVLFEDDYAPVVISKLSVNVESTDKHVKGEETNSTKGLKVEFDKDIKELKDALKVTAVENAKKAVKDAKTDAEKATAKANLIAELKKELKAEDFFTVYRLEVSRKGKEDAKDVKVVIEDIESDSITISFEKVYVNDKHRDYDYVLEVEDFTDVNRNRMVREYIDFQIVPEGTAFDVKGDIVVNQVRNNVEVVIEFTKSVDKDEAEMAKNYFFGKAGKDLIVDEAIVEKDGKTVSLIIKDTTVAKVEAKEVLEISPRVTSIDGDKIDGSRFFDLKTGKALAGETTPEAPKEVKVSAINETQKPVKKIDAVAPKKASITGIEFKADVSSDNAFELKITKGSTVTTEIFTVVAVDPGNDNSADLDVLAAEINAKNLGVKATVDTGKLNIVADEAIEAMKLAVSGSGTDTVPTPVDGEAEVLAADKVNQVVGIVFDKLADGIVPGMDVTFTGQVKTGKVTDINGNVVEVTIEIDDADINKALDYTTAITGITFTKGTTNVVLGATELGATLKVTAK